MKRGENMESAIIASIVTAVLTLMGTLYIQKRNNDHKYKRAALYLYLNLRQLKKEIDDDKKNIDSRTQCNLMPYPNQIDYISVICSLNEKLSKEDILSINEFYEKVKILNNAKMGYAQAESNYYIFLTTGQNMGNPYDVPRNNMYQCFTQWINVVCNDENYKKNIVEIISKLEKMKDK